MTTQKVTSKTTSSNHQTINDVRLNKEYYLIRRYSEDDEMVISEIEYRPSAASTAKGREAFSSSFTSTRDAIEFYLDCRVRDRYPLEMDSEAAWDLRQAVQDTVDKMKITPDEVLKIRRKTYTGDRPQKKWQDNNAKIRFHTNEIEQFGLKSTDGVSIMPMVNSAINSSERFWRVVVFRESENGIEKLVYKDMIPTLSLAKAIQHNMLIFQLEKIDSAYLLNFKGLEKDKN